MKIVYCINSVLETGGAERITVTKANALAAIPGNQVYILVSEPLGDPGIWGLSSEVSSISLNINYHDNNHVGLRYLAQVVRKKIQHKRALQQALCEIRPDIVISVGDEFGFLPSVRSRCRRRAHLSFAIVRELHHSKVMAARFYSHSLFNRLAEYVRYVYRYHYAAYRYDRIIALTHEDKDLYWKHYRNMSVIPNPITFKSDLVSNLDSKKVIAIGRLVEQKNFASLIRSFRRVADQHPDWRLEIYGDGVQKQMLQELIDAMDLEGHVFFGGGISHVAEKMSEASCFVLSSLFEGLPLVILEAMSCGLPVVSYDCPCGPRDIIHDGIGGFLVPLGDEKQFAEKIIYLIEHDQVRKAMGAAAKKRSAEYDLDRVIPMWSLLFRGLAEEQKQK